jgi:hypothetical protein
MASESVQLSSKANIDRLRNGWFSEVNDQWEGKTNRRLQATGRTLGYAHACDNGRCIFRLRGRVV